jgi:hypothetical protein
MKAPMFRVPRIEIGGVAFDGVVGHVQKSDPSYPAPAVFMQGIIGEPFFQAWKIVLDYASERMMLIRGDSGAPEQAGCRGTVVPFLPEWDGAPVTKATTDIGEVVMVWDTGAPVSVIRQARAEGTGARAVNKFYATARFALGGEDFGPLQLRLLDYEAPGGTDGIVGHSFFATHVVCVDFQRNSLCIGSSRQILVSKPIRR